jgi:hypothetical protein
MGLPFCRGGLWIVTPADEAVNPPRITAVDFDISVDIAMTRAINNRYLGLEAADLERRSEERARTGT